ncbi:MAG TPA: hypothetical protein VE684_16290 [Crenalkalicoccus sp.]|jgi:Ca2+-binding RTX toxin-like protein|nr:hypothetical protein [Crenalkalicoccus sp.]
MDDFATLPGGIYVGTDGNDDVHANHDIPGSFDNLILTFQGNDTVHAGLGNDVVVTDDGQDQIFGGAGNDTLLAGDGNDQVHGGGGADLILAGDGQDQVTGDGGNDTLIGGGGNDTLSGGDGHNEFVFESGFGKDVVMDFHSGDLLAIQSNINGLSITSATDLVPHISGDASSSVITLGQDTIKLIGISKADLLGHLDQYVKIV